MGGDRTALSPRTERSSSGSTPLPAFPEYWIVDEVDEDPLDASVEIYHLQNGGYVPARVVRLSDLLATDS
jgi:hypothetical protein